MNKKLHTEYLISDTLAFYYFIVDGHCQDKKAIKLLTSVNQINIKKVNNKVKLFNSMKKVNIKIFNTWVNKVNSIIKVFNGCLVNISIMLLTPDSMRGDPVFPENMRDNAVFPMGMRAIPVFPDCNCRFSWEFTTVNLNFTEEQCRFS
jgi:hypothetical protein